MASGKKFGTFGGVFTPSILTILGVIMYLRLPWIVGQAGLWTTLGIIFVAHIISFTTGLSVSSIATDKKVQAGGNYYIISRSLGLPIGGTLGFALFIGLSASISLYIIGFNESLLPFLGIESTLNNIRIAGSITLLVITGIVFISTSLAIKTQYLILGAVGLSLVVVFLGNGQFKPEAPLFLPAVNGRSLMELFGIFFPAVTGFTAGVQMSGDLKDPKKSIPLGTMGAILVGFLVYTGLTVYLAFFVRRELLISNTNILTEIAMFSPLVLAGIWGATLSSAMGSILGAPRILQAMSVDGITPRIFAKGSGLTNEPRVALIVSFVLAEAGILIGELNMIARIVSIFFITSYGVLNLSFAIERFASSDFRPTFKVPTWIGVIGALASFWVMLELDILAFLVSTVTLAAIFLLLQRRQLTLESGDTWEGVWSLLVRTGLAKLNTGLLKERNWRPNIILFSGGTQVRPHLIELAKWLAYKRGIVSNFDLIDNPRATLLFNRTKKMPVNEEQFFPGFFTSRLECRDVYEGMDNIVRVYGFPGIEPNLVLLGWARNTRHPQKFFDLLRQLRKQDYNILALRYQPDKGFGRKEVIDFWWRGASNNAAFALILVKFIQMAEEWQRSRFRIFIIIEETALANKVYRNMNEILQNQRIKAEVRVINNAIEKLPFPQILARESGESDLVLLGMPEITSQNPEQVIEQTNSILEPLGSVLLLSASSYFTEYPIGIERKVEKELENTPVRKSEIPVLLHFEDAVLQQQISGDDKIFMKAFEDFYQNYLRAAVQEFWESFETIEQQAAKIRDSLQEALSRSPAKINRLKMQAEGDFLYQVRKSLSELSEERLQRVIQDYRSGIEYLLELEAKILQEFPKKIQIQLPEDNKGDKTLAVPYRKVMIYLLREKIHPALLNMIQSVILATYKSISELQKAVHKIRDDLKSLQQTGLEDLNPEKLLNERNLVLLGKLKENLVLAVEAAYTVLLTAYRNDLNTVFGKIFREGGARFKPGKTAGEILKNLSSFPEVLEINLKHLLDFDSVEATLLGYQYRLQRIVEKRMIDPLREVNNHYLNQLDDLIEKCRLTAEEKQDANQKMIFKPLDIPAPDLISRISDEVYNSIEEIPLAIEVLSEESFSQLADKPLAPVQLTMVSLRRMVEYRTVSVFLEKLEDEISAYRKFLIQQAEEVGDVVRLLNFQAANIEELEENEKADQLSQVFNDSRERLENLRTEMEAKFDEVNQFLRTLFRELEESLNPYLLTQAQQAGLGLHTAPASSRMVVQGVGARFKKGARVLDNLISNFIYQKSEGVLFARQLQKEGASKDTFQEIYEAVRQLVPNPGVLNALPLYYRQLFTGRFFPGIEFWIPRITATQTAQAIVEAYSGGKAGNILVLGEQGSGKSTLSGWLADKFFSKSQIMQLYPPQKNEHTAAALKKELQTLVGAEIEFEEWLKKRVLPMVLILHDLETWWKRSEDGADALHYLTRLMTEYPRKLFVIANLNSYSYEVIRHIIPIHTYFAGIVESTPFNARKMEEAIMRRHRASGLHLFYKGSRIADLSPMKRAKIFMNLFRLSGGNIGAAFKLWLSSIKRNKKGEWELQLPEVKSPAVLGGLSNGAQILLLQLLLHKRMSKNDCLKLLANVQRPSPEILDELLRTNLIEMTVNDVLRINPYAEKFVIEYFKQVRWI
ncbi:MAG: hypothetical protein Kow0037_24980 [Calditrichia bacterium]